MSRTATIWLAALIAILVVLPWLVNPYVLQIVILTITYSMLGLAFALSLKVGLPRFDIAGWWAIGAYTTAMLVIKTGMSFWLTIPIGGLIGVLLGLLVFSIIIPRGTLIHHYKVNDDGAMTWANLIVATGHNNLAIGRGITQVAKRFVDGNKIQEGALNRVSALVRAYDPCLSCSTHALGTVPLLLQLLGPNGELLDELRADEARS
jgi:hypothetical protein